MLSVPRIGCSQIERAKNAGGSWMTYGNILRITVMILVPLVLIVVFFLAK